MAWAIITIYSSKCAQMDPQQLLKTSKFYSRCKKCDIEKTLGGGSPKVKASEILAVTTRIVSVRISKRLTLHITLLRHRSHPLEISGATGQEDRVSAAYMLCRLARNIRVILPLSHPGWLRNKTRQLSSHALGSCSSFSSLELD